jgi:integrase
MAYVRKRGSTWHFTVSSGKKPDGSPNQAFGSGFNTKKEAQIAAGEIEKEVRRGTYVRERHIMFIDFAEEWIQIYAGDTKPSSVRIRKHELGLLSSHFGKQQLHEITKKAYQKALLDLRAKGLSPNTISGVHCTARMLFKKAREFDLIKADPTEFARLPRTQVTIEQLEQGELPKYMEKEELAIFLKTAEKKGIGLDFAAFLTLAHSGMRVGELCALKWSDIDFVANTIRIIKTYYNPNNDIRKYALQTPKTKRSKRIVEVAPSVIKELEKHQAQQNKIKTRHPNIYHDEDFVFTIDKYPGYPAYIKLIETRMARLLKLAGLNRELTPHSLRHTHTSLLAEAGVGLEEIMERLGHSDDETTKNVYLHVTKAMKKEAAQKFSELMSGLS